MSLKKAISDRIRVFNKYVTNRLTYNLAHASHGPVALVRHVGRRSGKRYETPIFVEPVLDGFIIALTYGPEVDWYRNVKAAGHCEILWHRKEYQIVGLESVDVRTGLAAFPQPEKLILQKVAHIQDFVKMKVA